MQFAPGDYRVTASHRVADRLGGPMGEAAMKGWVCGPVPAPGLAVDLLYHRIQSTPISIDNNQADQ